MNDEKVKRNHKDSLFCDIFSDRKNALSLYNAIHGTEYSDENEIEIITLKDVVFIGYRNDVSFFFDSKITLWEHQSTMNKNMPLRGLIHYVQCVDGYLEKRNIKKKIFRKAIVKIPAPDYYVLYNGTDEALDRQEMHLSDAFMTPVTGYEWTAKLININANRNKALMDACASLKGYSKLVEYMREGIDNGLSEEDAADEAIERCINEGLLKEYLLQRRGEAKLMLLHFDENDLKKSLEEEREEERELIGASIERIRAGATREELLAEGIDEKTVAFAIKYA